jgi:imidazolonepropionase-like amidohydrolase/Tol biopolymer transport system component
MRLEFANARPSRILPFVLCGSLLLALGTAAPAGEPESATTGTAKKEGEKKWDVSNPPGPFDSVEINTDEGTWMSVDVSPDGKTIVFDLLGDIYRIPISGGDAEALTSGVAWDMQPCYSPDGRHIAFTSDRGGGDNIWIMDRDGSHPKQVTKEDFRLVNSPTWTPDSQYIAARKHFTSRRSLGAGEVWLYHISGGEGVQMTKRPNDQKDLGEPAFSPDGRYLYFSQDVTAGRVFEYNKDPNGEIYAIKRLDREKGETEDFISEPGGSIRPTPSPDGRCMAFVRRVRYKSTLFLHEIESGRERPLYDGLDRDMQETWAIHGVYPHMAWTPDSKSLVFWAGGRMRRIDIATKEISTIPFRVKTSRKIARALRYPVEVAPDKFKVKALRWVEVSPDGKQVLFQALGHLYVRSLPDGQARRLTKQNDHFEFFPSWSRDGKWIVYTTWNDETLGMVRVVSAKGGEGRVITPMPGHYVEPALAPDGTKVVYRKVSEDDLRTPTWTHEKGIFWVPVEGGKPRLITKTGIGPHFGESSDRIYLLEVTADPGSGKDPKTEGGEPQHALISIDLNGSEKRTHFVSENATEYCVSPDGKWVAFAERFNAYIVPFVRSGKEIAISPKTKAIPIRRVSRDAGQYLHWSGDSKSLHWSLGPELFTCNLADAFNFLEGAPEKLPEPPAKGVDIGFEANADIPGGSLAFVGARIITVRGDEVIEDGTIVIEKNRIKAVGPKNEVVIPKDALVVDVAGKTMMPGMVDVHAHGPYGGQGIIPQRNWEQYANLAFGVTTNHDPSNDTMTVFPAGEMQRAGLLVTPRIFSTGNILYGAAGPIKVEIESLDDARSHLRRLKAVGASSVKSYNQPRRDQRQQVIAAARELGLMVVPEGGSLFQTDMTMIVDGHTGIEHNLPVARAYQDVMRLWSASATGYTPTLIVAYGGLSGEYYWYQHGNVWEHKRLLTFVPRKVVDPRSRRRTMAPENEFNHIDESRICKQLADIGVRVNLGAHGQLPGLGAQWELWMLVQGGMTPLEAIRAATFSGARYVGLDGDIGSLEPGKLADLVVMDRNPLENIRNSDSIRYVVLNGRIYDASTMDQIGNHPEKRGRFYWETD